MSMIALNGYAKCGGVAAGGYSPPCKKAKAIRKTRQELRAHFTAYLDLWKGGRAPVKLEMIRPATIKLRLDMSRPAATFTTFTFSVSKVLGLDADITAEPDLEWD